MRNDTPLKRGFKRFSGLFAEFSIGEFGVWFFDFTNRILLPQNLWCQDDIKTPGILLLFLLVLLCNKFENKIHKCPLNSFCIAKNDKSWLNPLNKSVPILTTYCTLSEFINVLKNCTFQFTHNDVQSEEEKLEYLMSLYFCSWVTNLHSKGTHHQDKGFESDRLE